MANVTYQNAVQAAFQTPCPTCVTTTPAGLRSRPIKRPATALATHNNRKTPNSFQRWPLVSWALRFMLANGPNPSTTHAGSATDHRNANMMPGTIRRIGPIQIPKPTRMARPTIAPNRESPLRSASAMPTARPRID